MNCLKLLFLAAMAIFIGSWYLEQEDNSACYYDLDSAYKGRKVCPYELPFVKMLKRVPPRKIGREQRISYIIFQTHEVDLQSADTGLAIETVIERNPEYEYRLYNGTERREFLETHMSSAVVAAYDKLIPNAYKADIFRYSAVYVNGGCYLDIGTVMLGHLQSVVRPTDAFLSSVDTTLGVNSAFFCSIPKHPILEGLIRAIVKRVAASEYGWSSVDVTGPWMFGKVFAEHFNFSRHSILPKEYDSETKLIDRWSRDHCFVNYIEDKASINGVLHFVKYPRYVQENPVGNQRHYNDFYNSRNIYNESVVVKTEEDYSIIK